LEGLLHAGLVRLGEPFRYLEEQFRDGDAASGILGGAGGDEAFETGDGVAGRVAAPVGFLLEVC